MVENNIIVGSNLKIVKSRDFLPTLKIVDSDFIFKEQNTT